MSNRLTDEYITEKVEAYNVAITALECHEPGSDGNDQLALKLRRSLAKRLNSEI